MKDIEIKYVVRGQLVRASVEEINVFGYGRVLSGDVEAAKRDAASCLKNTILQIVREGEHAASVFMALKDS